MTVVSWGGGRWSSMQKSRSTYENRWTDTLRPICSNGRSRVAICYCVNRSHVFVVDELGALGMD